MKNADLTKFTSIVCWKSPKNNEILLVHGADVPVRFKMPTRMIYDRSMHVDELWNRNGWIWVHVYVDIIMDGMNGRSVSLWTLWKE